ncbi:MAG: alpha/beta hydrolase [Anaerolineaceae bacterium]|nr:alpha/beta hydrolase [Anaerolineaceae bacterium]
MHPNAASQLFSLKKDASFLINSDQIRISYVRKSDYLFHTTPIIFGHGLGTNLSQFSPQSYFMESHQMIAFSIRGHGESGMPPKVSRETLSLPRLARDVLELADHEQINQFHYVGHSLGGNIGYELLKIAPDRLASLTTFGALPKSHVKGEHNRTKSDLLNLFGWLPTWNFLKFVINSEPSTRTAYLRMLRSLNPKVMTQFLEILSDFDYLDILQHTQVPVLILRMEQDPVVNSGLDLVLPLLEKQKNIQVIHVNSAGHLFNVEKPNYFNRILESFLKKVEIAKSAQLP